VADLIPMPLTYKPLVAILMGSKSDWETVQHCSETLKTLSIPHEARVISAHRTPDLHREYATSAERRGIEVIIAAAGGAAHLAGVTAAHTILPVIGVPMQTSSLNGMDSLLSIVQMPAGIPVATMAIGRAGAVNAALFAAAIVARTRPEVREAVVAFRKEQSAKVTAESLPGFTDTLPR
jgi:5-(carboxyamino)imidazole ribonucleotide mutase